MLAAPEDERVKEGDRLVVEKGEHEGKPVTVDLVPLNGPPLAALPVDPATQTVRDGSRFNQLLLIRLPVEAIDEDAREHAADGVLAYSAICTHQGCEVSAWMADKRLMACFCHNSRFDPAEGGRVVGGPARARLPILPLGVADGKLVVVAGFTSKPGPRN